MSVSCFYRTVSKTLIFALFFSVVDSPKPPNYARIRGIDGVKIDLWYSNLFDGKIVDALPKMGSSWIVAEFDRLRAAQSSRFIHEFFDSVLLSYGKNYSSPELFLELAHSLYSARDQIRLRGAGSEVRGAMFLLSLLTEETLYVAGKRFPHLPREWTHFPEKKSTCARPPSVGFQGLPLCEGDIILSKGEEFSSALLLFRAPQMGIFSHSAFVVRSGPRRVLNLLEAEAYGGSLSEAADEGSSSRLSVYRLSKIADPEGKNLRRALGEAEKIIRVGQSVSKRVAPNSLFSFNIGFKPECRAGAYFCTELLYCLFSKGGSKGERTEEFNEQANPYSESYWSTTTEDVGKFAAKIWELFWGATPLPGDIELNPAYELVGHRVDLNASEDLRFDFIILNAFANILADDPRLSVAYADALIKLGPGTMGSTTEETIRGFEKLRVLRRRDFQAIRKFLPPEMAMKQLISYYHIQHDLLPGLLSQLQEYRAGGIPRSLGDIEAKATPLLRESLKKFVANVQSQTDPESQPNITPSNVR